MNSPKALVAPYSGIELISSQQCYPNAQGEGLPLIQVQTELCQAVIALQGAQLLEFTTTEGTPLLWLSPQCQFKAGKALRGGIPICLPWFGPHPTDGDKPQHGFARTSDWQLTQVAQSAEGRCELWFELNHQPDDRCDQAFTAELRMVLGKAIELELSVTNRDEEDFACTWALHSYFPVASTDNASVPGLAERDYLDNLQQHRRERQTGPLYFTEEVDRVFPGVETPLTIADSTPIRIEHDNCPSVVAWNPGAQKAAKMADVGAGNEQGFICIERGAVLDEGWTLSPGERRSGKLVIRAA